jgi:hypothetical protein
MPVIGFFDSRSPDALLDRLRGFRQGLKDNGFVEGDNVTIVYRWAGNEGKRLPPENLLLVGCGFAMASLLHFANRGPNLLALCLALVALQLPASIATSFQGSAQAFQDSLSSTPNPRRADRGLHHPRTTEPASYLKRS